MPTFVGFNTFAALPEEQISEKISRRILAGDQGMLVWSIGAGVHVEPHSHANEQIAWMLKGKMEFRLPNSGSAARATSWSFLEARSTGMVSRRHRGDRFLRASARGLSTRRQTCLHERGLNSPLRLLSPSERAHVQFAPRCAPRCERGSSLESKHRCRLGGDCANLFRPPRVDITG